MSFQGKALAMTQCCLIVFLFLPAGIAVRDGCGDAISCSDSSSIVWQVAPGSNTVSGGTIRSKRSALARHADAGITGNHSGKPVSTLGETTDPLTAASNGNAVESSQEFGSFAIEKKEPLAVLAQGHSVGSSLADVGRPEEIEVSIFDPDMDVRRFENTQHAGTREIDVYTGSIGKVNTKDFKLYFFSQGAVRSPWHGLPTYPFDEARDMSIVNFVCEIPKLTRAKFEVAKDIPGNPIKQDISKGALREYPGPIYWNYGMVPQTWEHPYELHRELHIKGDNDPLDLIEIGSAVLEVGSITQVKVLGVLAMIDDGELDWKVIAINANDPLAEFLTDISGVVAEPDPGAGAWACKDFGCPSHPVEKCFPEIYPSFSRCGLVNGIREWLRWYKVPDGKPHNTFGYEEKALGQEKAMNVIEETRRSYERLKGYAEKRHLANVIAGWSGNT